MGGSPSNCWLSTINRRVSASVTDVNTRPISSALASALIKFCSNSGICLLTLIKLARSCWRSISPINSSGCEPCPRKMSVLVTMPIALSWSIMGKWWMLCSLISNMASKINALDEIEIGETVMAWCTAIWPSSPAANTRLRKSLSVKIPTSLWLSVTNRDDTRLFRIKSAACVTLAWASITIGADDINVLIRLVVVRSFALKRASWRKRLANARVKNLSKLRLSLLRLSNKLWGKW